MKFIHSFRTRLFTGFLAASLVPVLVCAWTVRWMRNPRNI